MTVQVEKEVPVEVEREVMVEVMVTPTPDPTLPRPSCPASPRRSPPPVPLPSNRRQPRLPSCSPHGGGHGRRCRANLQDWHFRRPDHQQLLGLPGPDGTIWNLYVLGGSKPSLYSYTSQRFDWVPSLASDFPTALERKPRMDRICGPPRCPSSRE